MFLTAIISVLLIVSNEQAVRRYLFWTVGGLESSSWEVLRLLGVPAIVCLVVIWMLSRYLNVLSLGDSEARYVGMSVAKVRLGVLVLVSIAASLSVSFVGNVGFVGLLVPNIVRKLYGTDYKVVIVMSMFFGSIFMIVR